MLFYHMESWTKLLTFCWQHFFKPYSTETCPWGNQFVISQHGSGNGDPVHWRIWSSQYINKMLLNVVGIQKVAITAQLWVNYICYQFVTFSITMTSGNGDSFHTSAPLVYWLGLVRTSCLLNKQSNSFGLRNHNAHVTSLWWFETKIMETLITCEITLQHVTHMLHTRTPIKWYLKFIYNFNI